MSINKHLLWNKLQAMLKPQPPKSPKGGLCLTVAGSPPSGDLGGVWYLLEKVIWNDPRKDCIFKSKPADWHGLPPSKSLFHAAPDCGLPIGNLTSQLFSNVYLHDFDCFVKNELQVEYYGRYVDDFVLIHPDKSFLLSAKEKIMDYLQKNSGLTLHPKKMYLQHYAKGFAFLGAYIMLDIDGVTWSHPVNIKQLQQVRASLNSYLGVLQHYRTYNIRRKCLLNRSHDFFRYGYLDGKLTKYSVAKKYLQKNNNLMLHHTMKKPTFVRF